MTKPISTEGSRHPWWYGIDGENKYLVDAWGDDADQVATKPGTSFLRRIAMFLGEALVAAVFVYGLFMCSVQAQSALPDLQQRPNAADIARMQMAMMMPCQPPIVPREAMVQKLAGEFGEVHDNTAYLAPNAVLELYINRDKGTWTIIVTSPDKQSCVVTVGVRKFHPEEIEL